MKIAQIVCAFPPYKGGMGNVAFQFSKVLSELGHDVVVFTPKYNNTQQEKKYNFKVEYLEPIFKIGNAAILNKISEQLKENNFDIIHLHYPFFGTAYFISKFKKQFPEKKLVVTYHMDAISRGLKDLIFKLYSKILMPKILNSADVVTVSSLDYIKNSQAKNIFKNNINKFIELPYGVNLEQFRPREKDKNLMNKIGVQPNDKVILFIGGLDKAHNFKGVEFLIKAGELLNQTISNFKILIIGEGELKNHYENLAQKLKLENKIKFLEVGEYSDLPKYYNLCDIFILPSINSAEAFGLVLVEAMACGKTVLTSDLHGVKTVPVNNELLLKPANIQSIANKIKWLLNNDELRKKFGGEGRGKAEKIYNWNKIIFQLEKIYKNMSCHCEERSDEAISL
jgi:glycosyltransferase involved in cell wall biosynthesis